MICRFNDIVILIYKSCLFRVAFLLVASTFTRKPAMEVASTTNGYKKPAETRNPQMICRFNDVSFYFIIAAFPRWLFC